MRILMIKCYCTSNYCSALLPLSVPEKKQLFQKTFLGCCLAIIGHSDSVWQQFSIPFVFRQQKIQTQKMEKSQCEPELKDKYWGRVQGG